MSIPAARQPAQMRIRCSRSPLYCRHASTPFPGISVVSLRCQPSSTALALLAIAVVLLLPACATRPAAAPVPPRAAPLVDYHQHLVSPAFAPIVKLPERDGAALVRELDAAGVERAVVLSVGYSFADERKGLSDPDRLTREQNDWTSAEVTKNAPRLLGFCSANPLRPVALQELERCLGLPGMIGIKLHLGNSGISLRDPSHLTRVQQLFALAQRLRAPVLMHMRARGGANYGAEDAQIFLDELVPMAPDIEIVVAHLGHTGPGYAPQADEVMAVFAAAAGRKDPRMRNLYFDVATNVTDDITTADAGTVAKRIRQVGPSRVLYGSDLNPPGGSISQGWEIFRTKVPLTAAELQQIANNRTRFAR
jgi:predicted TIM-barrel fold metal-dependent hydrolase